MQGLACGGDIRAGRQTRGRERCGVRRAQQGDAAQILGDALDVRPRQRAFQIGAEILLHAADRRDVAAVDEHVRHRVAEGPGIRRLQKGAAGVGCSLAHDVLRRADAYDAAAALTALGT